MFVCRLKRVEKRNVICSSLVCLFLLLTPHLFRHPGALKVMLPAGAAERGFHIYKMENLTFGEMNSSFQRKLKAFPLSKCTDPPREAIYSDNILLSSTDIRRPYYSSDNIIQCKNMVCVASFSFHFPRYLVHSSHLK